MRSAWRRGAAAARRRGAAPAALRGSGQRRARREPRRRRQDVRQQGGIRRARFRRKKTWRGDDRAYGYVAPGAANGDCRDLTHTVYINGRPRVGKGTACKADGGWKLKS